ncbi:unnamed protein product [Lactuca virosa]|uniref:Uncharacterized protein n=1 Tax=Lactuca virosa TaxID=75947 RepID=A0AAU9PT07_9ASTR|nr:unnamed protein product [Lactuca virosa]
MNADPWARPNFNLWSVSVEPPKNTPVVEYRKANDKLFTIRVVHGGFFTDYPGKAYQQTKVHFISHVNIDLLDMELLGRFSRSLGYTSLGNWLVFVPNNFPHFLMNSPAKRVEKLIHMFVTEHPTAWVDDGIAYIQHMLNMTIPREKMEDAMDMAKENVAAWKNIA